MDKTEEVIHPFVVIDDKDINERFRIRRELYDLRRKEKKKLDKLASKSTVTLGDIAFALQKFKGSVVEAADFLGMHSAVLRRKIKTTPSLRNLMEEIRQDRIDLIEQQLLEQAEGGVMSAITFVLSRLAGDRGYSDKLLVDGKVENNVNAASLIAAMKNAAEAKALADKTVEVEEYTCLPES